MSSPSSGPSQPAPPGSFLTRFLGNLRTGTVGAGNPRPNLPRSFSSPAPLRVTPSQEGSYPDFGNAFGSTAPSGSGTSRAPAGEPIAPVPSNASNASLGRRFKLRRSRNSLVDGEPETPDRSPPASPPPTLPPSAAATTTPMSAAIRGSATPEAVQPSPGSPATIRGKERNPLDAVFEGGADSGPARPQIKERKSSTKSQQTILAHDHAYVSGYAPASSLERIEEPGRLRSPLVDQSLELISTLLPPALLLLSQLGPTHLFSPPLKLPSLFGVSLAAFNDRDRDGSISTATGSNAVLSSAASAKSDATEDSATASYASGLPTADNVIPSHSHELHAPNTLSMPAVSAAALWRLFRGFEWIGEVGRGAQPLPPTLVPQSQGGDGGGPPVELEDEPEQVFDFPSLLQGVADVLAADAAARGIELVVGQAGSGTAPSPAVTPSTAEAPGQAPPRSADRRKAVETRELLVRADERAWSVTLIWILHHILAGAAPGSTVDLRFLATSASPPTSPAQSRPSTPPQPDLHGDLGDAAPSRPQQWWDVSLDISVSAPEVSPTLAALNGSAPSSPALPTPPLGTPFARSLFSLIQLGISNHTQPDATTRSWALQAMLPAARPKAPPEAGDPKTLYGRRNVRLDAVAGQEPTINDLKRFADFALKGLKVALHAGENSAFAKDLTVYLAGWGMDVQHVPVDVDSASGGSRSPDSSQSRGVPVPPSTARFDSGFETATTSPTGSADGKPEAPGTSDMPSSLVIIDDDVATLRRLLVSLRAPPLHYAPTLLSKRPQLSSRRARSTPHVRQTTPSHSQLHAGQWVIIHFASLIDYKEIREIVQDALATSRQPNLPEVLVVPKPAGPRRIMTAIWSALKRPSVDPSLPPIATSPASPGVKYRTPRLSPSLNSRDREFDFSGAEDSLSTKAHSAGSPASSTKARTPPISAHTSHAGSTLPPSPLGKISDTADSYFSTVSDELKESTPSEGMVVQSPDGRSGIFFQPQPRSRGSSFRERMRWVSGLERAPSNVARDNIPEETADDLRPSPEQPAQVAAVAPHEIGLGSRTHSRRPSSGTASTAPPAAAAAASPPAVAPPDTPALALDAFISAAKSGPPASEDVEEEPNSTAQNETLSRVPSTRSPPPSRRSHSGSSGTGATAPTSPRPVGGTNPSSPGASASAAATAASSAAAADGAAAAQALRSPPGGAPGSRPRTKSASTSKMPKAARRRSSRRGTLPAVPPISVLIVEDNPINQTILSVFMRKKGITYKVAKDGQQAVDMWKKGNFHLVLMDIQLPVKSGIDATREIREMERQNNVSMLVTTPTSDIGSPASSSSSNPLGTPNSPLLNMPVIIVALTASSLQADRVAALAAGCNDFLTKPVSLPWLESKLVEWGSMAYLSGFSRRSESSSSEATSAGSASSRSGAPMRPRSRPRTPSNYTQGFASRAEVVSQHLHIERPTSRAPSPARPAESLDAIVQSPLTSPDPSPPSQTQSPAPSASTPRDSSSQPTLQLSSPTPQPSPLVATDPPTADTPAGSAGGDAEQTLDGVEEALQDLAGDQPAGDQTAS